MGTREAVEAYVAAFNGKDAEGLLALLSEHVVHDVNEGATEAGKDRFRAFKAGMDAAFEERLEDVCVMVNGAGDRACAEFVVRGRYLGTVAGFPEARGQSYVIPACAIFEVREGLIQRVTSYYNLRAWIDAIEGEADSA